MPEQSSIVDMSDQIARLLLAHYATHARVLPWRAPPGEVPPDPYAVWLSEIMLQQTTVAAVIPYFEAFTARWPTVAMLAAADDADVMAAWAGLGYYSRARNLLKCARMVVDAFDGVFPSGEADLIRLPGVGPYTAAAVAAIAYGACAVVVDGNVERVIARLHQVTTPLPHARGELRQLAAHHTPPDRAGDYAQALMDLGATICKPRAPRCELCPISAHCGGSDDPTRYPVRATKRVKPHRTDTAFWLTHECAVFLVTRPPNGLLGGMRALPVGLPPVAGDWQSVGTVNHIFTHFALTLTVKRLAVDKRAAPLDGVWWPVKEIERAGLPSVFSKAAQRAMEMT